MILDKIENLSRYEFDFDFIPTDLKSGKFDVGKVKINDAKAVIGLTYETKPEDEGLWEAHRKNLDIHVIIEGAENIAVSPITTSTPTNSYQEEGDYQLFETKANQIITLQPGYFLVLFPNEVHKTGIQLNESEAVTKKVYKVAYDE